MACGKDAFKWNRTNIVFCTDVELVNRSVDHVFNRDSIKNYKSIVWKYLFNA